MEAPPLSPPSQNLIRLAAGPIEPTDDHWIGGVSWLPEACGDQLQVERLCQSITVDLDANYPGVATYEPFILIAHDTCSAFGWEAPERRARALRILNAQESYEVEREFWGGALNGANAHLAQADVNEVQTLTITATGGTYTLTYDGQTTAAIAWDANAAAIDAALEALSNIGAGDVTVAGAGPYTITFTGALAQTDVSQLTVDATSLTGGTATLTTTTGGDDNADTITSSAQSPIQAMALLDQALSDARVGKGMIHARPYIVNLWQNANLLTERGGRLETVTGHVVVPGAGYSGTSPAGAAPGANSEFAYATEMIGIVRQRTPDVREDMPSALDRANNTLSFTAQRAYAILWSQCAWLAAEIDPTP